MASKVPTWFASACALALFFFIFLDAEFLFDTFMGLFTDAQGVVRAQSFVVGASVVGFLLFVPFARKLTDRPRLICALIGTVILVICLILIAVHPGAVQLQTVGCIAFVLLGIMGAAAHWGIAVTLSEAPHLARIIAFSYAAGLLLQFFANNLLAGNAIAEFGMLILATLFSVFLLLRYPGTAPSTDAIPAPSQADRPKRPLRTALCLIGVVALMTCLFGTLDNIVTLANASGQVNVAAWPRLFLAGSAIVAGFLFDFGGRRFMTLIAFCVTLLSTICVLVVEESANIWVGLIVFYLCSGFYVVFFTTAFIALSKRMHMPQLWSGMGRIVNNTMAIAIGTPSLMLVSTGNAVIIIAIDLVLFVAIALLLFGASGIPTGRPAEEAPAATLGDAQRLVAFCSAFGLTRREQQILACLMEGDTDAEISEKLFISANTVRFHVSNLMKKTQSANRTEAARKAQSYTP